jgi:alpha-L-fucosidase
VEEYEPLARQFNPVKFDARQWVSIAKSAGMKYIVITSKHHDGFCLFDSKYTDYDIVDATPFKRDVLKELAQECQRQGLRLCFYHSIMDWHHPDYLPRRRWDTRSADNADFDRYVAHLKNQVRELVTNYGPLGVMWFDGEWEHTWTHTHGLDLYKCVRSIQPDIIVNNRVDKGRRGMAGLTKDGDFGGDFGTPEQEVPPTGLPGADWETCMTMNDTWGFKKHDHNWKSAEELVRTLVDVVSKGGNFLLNVGPTALGEIAQPSVERLQAIGRWISENGESIYGTSASPFRHLLFDGRCTVKGNRLYLHVFEWPADRRLQLHGLRNKVEFVQFLKHFPVDAAAGDLESFGFEQVGETVTIYLPGGPFDPADTVLVVLLDRPPDVDASAWAIRARADGALILAARFADVHGNTARYESGHGKDNIGYWTDAGDWVSWPIRIERLGEYEVWLTQATEAGTGGSEFVVAVAGQEIAGVVAETSSWTAFKGFKLGTLWLPVGKHELSVKVRSKPGPAVMNLKHIELRPATQ